MEITLGQKVGKLFERAETERVNFDTHWQTVSDLMMPSRQFTNKRVAGDYRRDNIVDDTAPKSFLRLASAIHGMLMNPATKWVNIKDEDPAMNMNPAMSSWQDYATNELLRMFGDAKFGFNVQSFELLLDLLGFGTAAMILADDTKGLRFSSRPLNEMYLLGDRDYNVDTVIRKTEWSADELYEEFGALVGEKIIRQIDNGKGHEKHTVLHAVFPRRERDPVKVDAKNKRFASVWVLREGNHVLRESGFDRFPYLIPRLYKNSDEVYGRGLGMTCLADIAMLNAERETLIVAGQKAVDPPLIVDANGVEAPIETDSGSIIYRRSGIRNAIEPLLTGGRLDIGYQILEQDRKEVKEAFMLDLVQLPMLDRMTATEVMQRMQQQLVFMSPMISRIQSEWLEPMVIQTLELMITNRMIESPPFAARIKPRFESVMAVSQRASESSGVTQWLGLLTQMAQIDPTVLDRVDFDALASYSANHWFNVPEEMIRTDEELEGLREGRSEQANQSHQARMQLEQAKAANQGAQALRNAAEAQSV